MGDSRIRVLVIEDSAFNRRTLVDMLESEGDVVVAATARDGEDGLRQALTLKPDVITLDLEMPGIDGFTFLRLLMARSPTPVVVVSSYARKADVFKALELGAFDFVAKPSRETGDALKPIRDELLAKIRTVRMLKEPRRERREPAKLAGPVPLVVIGASTGGPPALQRLFSALPAELPCCILVAQHMPEKFTTAFAERLHKNSSMQVAEAKGGERLEAGRAFVAPGGRCLRVERSATGALTLEVRDRTPQDKYLPSIDELFESVSRTAPKQTLGVILTGMGSDGREGMLALKRAGARTVAESEESAVIFGMPKEAISAGAVDRVLTLEEIIPELVRFARARGL